MKKFTQFSRIFLNLWRRSKLFRGASLLTACLLSTLLAALAAMSQPVVLTFLMNAPEVEPLRPIIQEFEQQNPGIRLNMVEGPAASNLIEDLNTSAFLLGDSPYDLVNLDVTWTSKFAAAGWLKDLSSLISDTELTLFLPADIDGGRYNGNLYRLPWRTDAGMLYYRKDLLEQAGLQPPETFTDLMQAATVLQKKNAVQWGYVWQGRQYEGVVAMFMEVLQGNNGFWINSETKEVGLDQPPVIAALQFLVNTIQQGISPSGVITYQEDEPRRLFQSGNTLLMRNWPYAWTLLNAEDSPVKGKVGIKPMVHAPGYNSAACLGGWGWGISSTTKHPQEAWKAVRFLTSEAAQRQVSLSTGYLPSRRALYDDPQILEKYSFFPLILQVLDNAVLRPPIAQYAQTSDILQRYLSAALSGRMSSESAMQAAATETRSLLDSSNKI
jgi:multiple sugar transport system substrate-binding protein